MAHAAVIGDVGRRQRLLDAARRPVDGSSLAVARIGIGLLTAWEGYRQIDNGWVHELYNPDTYHFTWWPLDVHPWPDPFMKVHMVVMILAGLALAVGIAHRWAAAVCWFTVTFMFLLDKANYLNHIYLLSLLLFLFIWLPAGRALVPGRRASTVPLGAVWFLRFQIGVPYVFAGIGKVNWDWLHGHPLDLWLRSETTVPIVGPLFKHPGVAVVLALAAMTLDLGVVPAMLHPRTRRFAYTAAVAFHFANSRVFSIGIFPWAMIVLTTVFLPPSWPRRLVADLRAPGRRRVAVVAGAALGAFLGATAYPDVLVVYVVGAAFGFGVVGWLLAGGGLDDTTPPASTMPGSRGSQHQLLLAGAALWVAFQVLMPLRHFVYPGDVHWTEGGHRFSWHMLLRAKDATLTMYVVTPTGLRYKVDLAQELDADQIDKMGQQPDLAVQFAHHLEDELGEDIQVYVDSTVSLNGRLYAPFMRSDVDLTTIPRPNFSAPSYLYPSPSRRFRT